MRGGLRTLLAAGIGAVCLSAATVSEASTPVSYRPAPDETRAETAARHGVSEAALLAANPSGADANGWLRLPPDARLPETPVVALMASAQAEIAEIVRAMQVRSAYRIVGREFQLGEWEGRPVLAAVAGGNQSNAAIGATLLFAHVDVRAMGFVGIAGGGGTMRIGDVLIASGAVQHDNGNWYDFQMAGGGTFAGMTWSPRGGPPVLSDAGRSAPKVLLPSPALSACLQDATAGVELPLIGPEVAAFHHSPPWRPTVHLDGWSASGAQFISSLHFREALERRMAAEAARIGAPPPAAFIVDQEDFGAVLAAEEHDVPWFVVRTVVDMAAQKQGVGLPLDLYDTPEAIPVWLAAHGEQSYARDFDWSYFYRQIEIVVRPIVRRLSTDDACLIAEAAPAPQGNSR